MAWGCPHLAWPPIRDIESLDGKPHDFMEESPLELGALSAPASAHCARRP